MSSRPPPRFALVSVASLDVRRAPGHASELGSQLLLGEAVRVLVRSRRGEWCRVQGLVDGYRGWVRLWGLLPGTGRAVSSWRSRARARVDRPWAEVREGPGAGALVSPLFWGSWVIPGRRRGRFRRVDLPGGVRGWVEARAVRAGRRVPPLAERVRGLLGVPYLWGGRTPGGMDCSGLAQLLLGERGCSLPRDAAEQERSCRPLGPREAPAAGDLAFFGPPRGPAGHVAVLLGGGAYVHARGRVRINHLDPGNQLFDKDLGGQFRGVRRPRPGAPGRPGRALRRGGLST